VQVQVLQKANWLDWQNAMMIAMHSRNTLDSNHGITFPLKIKNMKKIIISVRVKKKKN